MSKETLVAFLKKVAQDPALQKEFRDLAARHGYDLSSDELGEGELDSVVGGLTVVGTDGEASDKDHKGWTDISAIAPTLDFKKLP
jgi:hypothetical protein